MKILLYARYFDDRNATGEMIVSWIPWWKQNMALKADLEDSVHTEEHALSRPLPPLYSKIECGTHYYSRFIHKLPNTIDWYSQLSSQKLVPSHHPQAPATLSHQPRWVGYRQSLGAKCILGDAFTDCMYRADPSLWGQSANRTEQ